jgi:uncharacterized protein with FMN-binding domain
MKRTVAALVATVVVLWLTLTFKSSPPPARSSALRVSTPTTAPPPPDTRRNNPSRSTTSTTPGLLTITGGPTPTKWGDVQVAVTLRGRRIVDVQTLVVPMDHGDSRRINTRAVPLLHDEVLRAQSAHIDTVSGATYTSIGYAQSLQSALDTSSG